MPPIGVLGGTFDPVHHGHLRLALEMAERLGLAEVRLIPVHQPPHRPMPAAPAAARLRMLELAVAREPRLVVDARELRRGGISYTVDTLSSLREEFRTNPLCLILGMDAFRSLPAWHQWERISRLAHLAVAGRPGADAQLEPPLDRLAAVHREGWEQHAAGCVLFEPVPLLDISSSRIRDILATGGNPRYLLPDPVLDYIYEHDYYKVTPA
jgi:nicotinate-nucleotide adenylyltransferase